VNPMPSGPVEVVAAAIIENRRLLLTQRRPQDRFPYLWELPGGKLDPGETREQALIRELEEELGITCRPGTVITTLRHRPLPVADLLIHVLRAERVSGEIRCLEVHDWIWATAADLGRLEIIPSNRGILARISRELAPA